MLYDFNSINHPNLIGAHCSCGQYRVHRQMQHDKGFPGSHWPLPSGVYSLRITPEAARATINTTMIQHVPTLVAILMVIAMWQYYTARIAQWRRFLAFIKATKRHHWASTHSNRHQSDTPMLVVSDSSSLKRDPVDMLAPNNNNNRGMTYQTDEKNLNNMVQYSVGVVKLAHYCYITRFLRRVINQ